MAVRHLFTCSLFSSLPTVLWRIGDAVDAADVASVLTTTPFPQVFMGSVGANLSSESEVKCWETSKHFRN